MINISSISIERPNSFFAFFFLALGILFFAFRYSRLMKAMNKEARNRIKYVVFFRTLFFSISIAMFIFAYAGISWGGSLVPVQKNGRAVSFVFDISYSMTAKDTKSGKSRLETAAKYAESIMDYLGDASISVVLAKGDGTVAVPLTEDREVVKGLLSNLSPELMTASGSSLGKGISAAIDSFPSQSSQAPYIWLFTDGEETDNSLLASINDAIKYGIPVAIIGFGSEKESEVLAGDKQTKVKTALRSDSIKSMINSVQTKNSKVKQNSVRFIKAEDKGSAYLLLDDFSEDSYITYETQNVKRHGFFIALGIVFLILYFIAGEFKCNYKKGKLINVFGVFVLLTTFSGCSSKVSCGKKILEGKLEWNRKNYQQSTADFLEALEMSRRDNDSYLEQYALYGLASTYLMLEENDAALERLNSISPDAADEIKFAVLFDSGLIAHKKGNYENAALCFKKALMIDGSNINAKKNLELSLEKISVQSSVKERNISSVSENNEDQSLENAIYSMMREKEQDKWKSQKQESIESGSLDY